MLQVQQTKTSAAAAALQTALGSARTMNNATAPEKQAIATLLKDIKGLPALRAQVRSQIISKSRALAEYNAMVADAYSVLDQAILEQTNATLVTQALAFVRMGRSEDLMLQESAIISGDLAARSFPAADRGQFTQLAGARRTLYSQTLPDLQPRYRAYYTRAVSPQAMHRPVRAGKPADERHPRQQPAAGPAAAVGGGGRRGGRGPVPRPGPRRRTRSPRRRRPTPTTPTWNSLLAGGLGLLAVILSILVSFVIGRGLIRELAALRESALELANERLPERGEPAGRRPGRGRLRRGSRAARQLGRDRPGPARLRRGTADRGGSRRGPGPAAAGHQRHLPQPGPAQPVAAAPPARPARRDGAAGAGSRRSSRTCSASTTSPPACGGTRRA